MKYSSRKKEFVKLTIRVEKEELDRFKKICEILQLSGNNQINILIHKFIFENRSLLDEEKKQIEFEM